MSDGAAIKFLSPEIACELVSVGDAVGAAYVTPMALLQTAVQAVDVTDGARLQAISVAYAMFRQQYDVLVASGLPYRGPVGQVLAFNTPDHLRRAMNLCVVLYWIIQMRCPADLSRIGTHPLELRFGLLRCLLRGVTRWNYFVGAETYAELVKIYASKIGVTLPAPAKRAKVGGAVLNLFPQAEPVEMLGEYTRDERGRAVDFPCLRAAARDFMSPDAVARRRSLPIFFPYLAGIAAFLEDHADATEDPTPDGFFAGTACEARYKALGGS
jgi:hypothetical protein